MAQITTLSDSDYDILREIVAEYRNRRIRPLHRPPVDPTPSAKTYVALTPAGGIPALTTLGTGTGTGDEDEPGFAECSVYRALPDGAIYELIPISHEVTVLNLRTSAISGDSWCLVTQDKFGTWWVAETNDNAVVITDERVKVSSGDTTSGTLTNKLVAVGGITATILNTGGNEQLQLSLSSSETGTGTPEVDCTAIVLTEEQVRCEDNALNVYTRTVDLNVISGCLVKTTGSWTFDRNEGSCGVNVVQYVNVENIYESEYLTENVIYFNEYNSTINILINNVWYTYCSCDSTTGTGFAEQTYWYCLEPPVGTGTGTTSYYSVTCCDGGIILPETLSVVVNSGCSCFPTSFTLTYKTEAQAVSEGYVGVPAGTGDGWYSMRGLCAAEDSESYLLLNCYTIDPSQFLLLHHCNATNYLYPITALTCVPFNLTAILDTLANCCSEGGALTITE